jgi:hypothetical protein
VRSSPRLLAACLCAGFTAAAPPAHAGAGNPRLDGSFVIEDGNQVDLAVFEVDGTSFDVLGSVVGLGTNGDEVEISFFTPQPSSVSATDRKAAVRQKRFSRLVITIESEIPERDLDLTLNPEQCDVNAKLKADVGTGSVTVSCSADNLYVAISPEELESIQTAFESDTRVKIEVSRGNPDKGSIRIRLEGSISAPM